MSALIITLADILKDPHCFPLPLNCLYLIENYETCCKYNKFRLYSPDVFFIAEYAPFVKTFIAGELVTNPVISSLTYDAHNMPF